MRKFKSNINKIVEDFDKLPLKGYKKPKVGVVGEILVKYHLMQTMILSTKKKVERRLY